MNVVLNITFRLLEHHIQNGVVERKNRTLHEMARTMLNENDLPKYFWGKAVNISCHDLNRVLIGLTLKQDTL